MRAPSFWWREPGGRSMLLAPLATLYGAVAAARMARAGLDIGIPVVCIGNLTVGGAGKTPAALAVASLLLAAGRRPWFLSRGYGGRRAGPVTVDPNRDTARDVGDEPLLLARMAPTVVAHDRPRGAHHARERGAGCIIMDDGFQNPSLHKQMAVLVVDGQRGIGNGQVLPAGPLRAPLNTQLARAQAMVVIGDIGAADAVIAAAQAHNVAVFYARLEPDQEVIVSLAGTEVLAFAGIGHPEKFFTTLVQAGMTVRGQRSFPDHHRYSKADAAALIGEAAQRGLTLITTEKDAARFRYEPRLSCLAARARILPVRLVLNRAQELQSMLLDPLPHNLLPQPEGGHRPIGKPGFR